MSFLAPLYALAALAIALPILFHLIRKQPRGRQVFSSLMFLEPSPPRLTKRSSIDQWLLLLLRGLALAFLAFAFSRPFWNEPTETDSEKAVQRRLILIDRSASMRREGLWDAALNAARQQIQQAQATDVIGVYAFDSKLTTLFSLADSIQSQPKARQEQALASLSSLMPSWMPTDLGFALMSASDQFQQDEDDETSDTSVVAGEIVVITDFQSGVQLNRLENYQWPVDCRVRIVRVAPKQEGNARAWIQWNEEEEIRQDKEGIAADEKLRVRVTNDEGSTRESFSLTWIDDQQRAIPGTQVPVPLAAGKSNVFRVPLPPADAIALRLEGDVARFDNDHFIANQKIREYQAWLIDERQRDPAQSLGYFAEQLSLSNARRNVAWSWRNPGASDPWANPSSVPWVIAGSALIASDVPGLKAYIEAGGHVLWVWDQPLAESRDEDALVRELALLTDDPPSQIREAKIRNYAVWENIQFKHPVFGSLADARFNDFTKIRFWGHRSVEFSKPEAWTILARFDDDRSPALAYRTMGKGTLWCMTSGWQPNQSQLALSSKFVPLMTSMFQWAAPQDVEREQWSVGDRIELVKGETLLDPTGKTLAAVEQENAESILLEEPGIYKILREGTERKLAVNVTKAEGETTAGDQEQLSRLGVQLSEMQTVAERIAAQRQLRAVELESQQSWWRWLLIAVIGVVFVETAICMVRPSQFQISTNPT